MAEEPTPNPEAGQDPTEGEPAAPASDPQAGPTPTGGDSEPQADSQKEITQARREAAKYRTGLRKAEEALEKIKRERDEEKLTADERNIARATEAEARAEAAEQRARELETQAAISAKIAGKVSDQGLATGAVLARLEYDSDGRPSNLDDALSQALKDHPALKPVPPATSPTNAASSPPVTTDRERLARVRGQSGRGEAIPMGGVVVRDLRAK